MTFDFLLLAQNIPGSSAGAFGDLGPWFPPIWTMSAGVLLGLLIVGVIYGIVALISPPGGKLIEELVFEGLLQPVFYASLVPAAFALLALFWAPIMRIFEPVPHLWLQALVMLGWAVGLAVAVFGLMLLTAVLLRLVWPNLGGDLTKLMITLACVGACLGGAAALSIPIDSSVAQRLLEEEKLSGTGDAFLMLGTARFMVALFLLAMALRIGLPKVSAVAQTTCKEGMAQPLFWVCVTLATSWMLAAIWLPYNTFGEDIKILKDQGLEVLTLIAILLAVATSSVSVSEELEGRTALTVLSKPIGRVQFILGKFLGVIGPVLLVFLILGFVLLCTTSYKVVYDGLESGSTDITHHHCRVSMIHVVPGLALRFIAAVMVAAISVTVATRLPLLGNLSICFVVYTVGRLAPVLVQSSFGRFEPVQFMGQLIAVVLPVFEHFDIQAGIAADQFVPLAYLLHCAFYGLCYCVFMLLLALVLFEDRDLA